MPVHAPELETVVPVPVPEAEAEAVAEAEAEASAPSVPPESVLPSATTETIPAPVVEATASTKATRPLPETLTAARDAAAFVAQLFAEVSAPEHAAPTPLVEDVPQPSEEESTSVEDETSPVITGASDEAVASPLQDQSVLILGLGASGLAMARWCARSCRSHTGVTTRLSA